MKPGRMSELASITQHNTANTYWWPGGHGPGRTGRVSTRLLLESYATRIHIGYITLLHLVQYLDRHCRHLLGSKGTGMSGAVRQM
jgi:hypothetical protein